MPQILLEPYSIYYELRGELHLPKLLFLHGFMGRGADFAAIVDALYPEFCCLTVDLPGHGRTDVLDPAGYGIGALAPALIEVLHRLDFTPCHSIGYSMGGRLALYLACCFPEAFASVLLESASPGLETEPERILRRQQDEILAVELESGDWPAFLTRWYERPLFAAIEQSRYFDEMFQRRLDNRPDRLAQALRGLGAGVQPSLWDRLPSLNVAISLIAGELDLKFVQINRRMADRLTFAHLEIVPGCGHAVRTEHPAAFIVALKVHLTSASQSSRSCHPKH
ncbi:2-succinyl-6-hydroxy-2,4-cyclohexadiene-1-carboxylate synthase [Altericista sp. CCNU0014]|uniref:2-succinyl-6-hydroxy-2, 4-cyclohexadiene-1-carboxylate synthase n=1 Tax=Altericista sp. CCNU0014 TaxID=3082949 RepID=UPI00384CC43A